MDNSRSEQESSKIKLSDLKKVYKTSSDIAEEVTPNTNKEMPPERRKLLRRIWNKLIPTEKKHKEELGNAINEGEIDLLTQTYNNRGFVRRWTEEIARLKRAHKAGTNVDSVLLYLDANMLKQINDERGHDAGDEYLKKIALALKEAVRPTDVVARIGGDEFAIILPGANLPSTRTLFEERILPQLISKGVSVSIGSELIDSDNPDISKEHADSAMYDAKRLSRVSLGTNEYREYGENIK